MFMNSIWFNFSFRAIVSWLLFSQIDLCVGEWGVTVPHYNCVAIDVFLWDY